MNLRAIREKSSRSYDGARGAKAGLVSTKTASHQSHRGSVLKPVTPIGVAAYGVNQALAINGAEFGRKGNLCTLSQRSLQVFVARRGYFFTLPQERR